MEQKKNEVSSFAEVVEKISCRDDIEITTKSVIDAIFNLTSCKNIIVGVIEKNRQDKAFYLYHKNMDALADYMNRKYTVEAKDGKKFTSVNQVPNYIKELMYTNNSFNWVNMLPKIDDDKANEIIKKENITSLFILALKCKTFLSGFMTLAFKDGHNPSKEEVNILKVLTTFLAQTLSLNSFNIEMDLIVEKYKDSIIYIEKSSGILYKNRGMELFLQNIVKDIAKVTMSEGCLILLDDKESSVSEVESFGDNKKLALCLKFIKNNSRATLRNYSGDLISEELRENGINTLVFEKLKKDGQNIGYIVMYNSPRYYDDIKILSIYSTQIVLAIYVYLNNKKMIESYMIDRDLELISNQQKLIMEDEIMKSDEIVEVDYIDIPYRFVGGDFCKFQKISDKKYFLFIADVMGHGVISNYFVAMVKGALNTLLKITVSPASIMNKLNKILFKELDKSNIFITAKAILFDFENNRLYSSNAGHTLPIAIYKKENGYRQHELIQSDSALALGILEDIIYQEDLKDIENLDLFAVYTDGILEMKNNQGEEFGIERLIDFLKTQIAVGSENICENLVKYLESYNGSDKLSDDITMLIVKKK